MSERPPDPWQVPGPQGLPPLPPPPGTWAAPPTAYPAPGNDGFSIAALILGIVPFMGGLLGIVFGIISLRRIKRSGQSGRGMAVTGIAAGSAWLLLITIGVTALYLVGPDDDGTSNDLNALNPQLQGQGIYQTKALTPGQCTKELPYTLIETIQVVPCDGDHVAEVFGTYTFLDPEFPGTEAAEERAVKGCAAKAADFVGLRTGMATGYKVTAAVPTEDSYADSQNAVCVLTDPVGALLTTDAKDGGHHGGLPVTTPAVLAPGQQSGAVYSEDLVVGNCIAVLGHGSVGDLNLVPCAKKHEGEVYATFSLPAGAYPGEATIERRVLERCRAVLPGFVKAPRGRSGYDINYVYPTKATWAADDRKADCIVEDPNHRPLVGEAKGKGRHR